MSTKNVEQAITKSDAWLDNNSEAIKKLHARHMQVQEEIMKKTDELYDAYYKERAAELAKIPSFWFVAFMKHPQIAIFLQAAQDADALTYLKNIEVVRGGSKASREFDLVFTFAANPYFSETTLTKSYVLAPADHTGHNHGPGEHESEDELAGKETTVSWKDDAHNLVKQYPRKVGSGDEDEDEDEVEPGSFFNLFTTAADPFQIGEIIVESVLPQAPEIYGGIAEFSDDEEDDEDDFEDDDSEDEAPLAAAPPSKKARK